MPSSVTPPAETPSTPRPEPEDVLKTPTSAPETSKSGPTVKSPAGTKKKTPAPKRPQDLSDPSLYLNRELSWLEFNWRLIAEAEDDRVPLLERVKFAAIASSNLDEFFMKRIGGLKQQLGARIIERTVDGRTPREQINECYNIIRLMQGRKQRLLESLRLKLKQASICLCRYDDLTTREKAQVRLEYLKNHFPLMTPQSIDPAHPFPFISNLSLNLLVSLRYQRENELSLARVKVPVAAGCPRFIRVEPKHRYVLLEEVMANNLDLLFPDMEVVSCEFFRVTRNANTEKSEEHADDLLAMIESELQERKFAPIVRLEILPGMEPLHRGRLAAELGLDEENDVFEVSGMMAMRDLMELTSLDFPHLKDPPHYPIDHPALQSSRNIFHIIRESGALLLQHPYESFTSSVERFLQEAAHDPKVRAIKMTLYRTSTKSRIIDTLIAAAQNGKQVAVVVELKARFDEAANIRFANRLEEGGIHVTYGVMGLKTHCKIILVIRQDYNGLKRYMHIGTGNYHADTSRIYSDLGLLTNDEQIGNDATELFNYLTTGFTPKRKYQKLLPAPKMLKTGLLDRIEREINLHSPESPGHIQFKINALEDADIVAALYRASIAGVRIDLLVRDSCRLRPGLPGLSETVQVFSIVGRFLEHARIYYFRNGGREEYFIGSADAMSRNLEHRVEVVAPVEDPLARQDLRTFIDIQLNDRYSAWQMQPDGSYQHRRPQKEDSAKGSHQLLIEWAEKRNKDVTRLKKRKVKGFGGKNTR